jgi:hypothetical protein
MRSELAHETVRNDALSGTTRRNVILNLPPFQVQIRPRGEMSFGMLIQPVWWPWQAGPARSMRHRVEFTQPNEPGAVHHKVRRHTSSKYNTPDALYGLSLTTSAPSFGFSAARLWRLARFSAAFNLRDISRCCRIDDDCLCPPITFLRTPSMHF